MTPSVMITNDKAASQVNELMLEIYRQMQESIDTVKETCAPKEYRAYNQAIGRVVASILFEVLEPLYRENPSLKPAGWDGEQGL